MTVTVKDGLFTFGSNEIVEVPPKLSVGGDIENTNDAVQKAPLGVLYRHKGNVYRYVLVDTGTGPVAAAAGGVVHWSSLDPANGLFTVVTDYSDIIGKSLIAGILRCVVTDGYYTWIQVGGVCDCMVNTSTVAGDVMIYSSTDLTFGRCAADAAVTALPYGVALEADVAGVGAVLLLNMIF